MISFEDLVRLNAVSYRRCLDFKKSNIVKGYLALALAIPVIVPVFLVVLLQWFLPKEVRTYNVLVITVYDYLRGMTRIKPF